MATNRNKILLITLIIIISILIIISIIGMILYRDQPEVLQGQIETTQVTISGKLLGRVEKFYVREGDYVTKGDTLVLIHSPEVDAQLQTASAMEEVAKYQNKKVDAGTRSEIIKSLKQAWEAADANYTLAKTTWQRTEKLYRDSVVTTQRMDEITALYKTAEAAKNAAWYEYQMALSGAQAEDKESAKALVNAAKGGVNAVEAVLSDAKLTTPQSGEIGSIYPSVGELVMPGTPIMDIVVIDSCYVVLNVREDQLPYFYMGGEFYGTVPALSDARITFSVFYMSPLGSFATWRSTKQTGSYDLVTFQIKGRPIAITDLQDKNKEKALLHRLRPGMSVLVTLYK